MKTKIITLLLSAALAASVITGCGSAADSKESTQNENAADSKDSTPSENAADSKDSTKSENAAEASFDELIASLNAGQSYTYAPICDGENALLVTSYTFDDTEGHQATYEATIFIEKDNSVEKVTTVQSGGTAYPIAVSDDNSLILTTHHTITKGHVSKDSGSFVITEESNVNYTEAEDGSYHNYKDGTSEVTTDSSLFDSIYDNYLKSEVLSFTKAGALSDGTPHLAGAVYAAYEGEDLYNISSYYKFETETSGSTETPDGISGIPFTYEQSGSDIIFHFASADDTTKATFGWENASFPTITFTDKNETITLTCLGDQDPATFSAARYYDNDNNLYMQVKKFDEKTLTGDLYREERIKADLVDNAKEGSSLFSINGTQFLVISFEDVNKELEYGTDEEFKKDVVGTTRFDKFLVKNSDDNFYYALEKRDYDSEYTVVSMLNEGNLRKLVEENVTFNIRENCEIILQKFVLDGDSGNLTQEYIIGREFKGDNYPGWSEDAKEYYMTSDMLVAISALDHDLYNFVQIYIP